MLIKNAMMIGIIMSRPTTRILTKSTIPNNSMERFTVNGMLFMGGIDQGLL